MLATMAELRGGLDGLRATHTFERVELEVGCGDGGFSTSWPALTLLRYTWDLKKIWFGPARPPDA